jgi:hypothetical protein
MDVFELSCVSIDIKSSFRVKLYYVKENLDSKNSSINGMPKNLT